MGFLCFVHCWNLFSILCRDCIFTFYLAFYRTYTLTFYLAFYLTYALAFYLGSILTFFLTFCVTSTRSWGPVVPTAIWTPGRANCPTVVANCHQLQSLKLKIMNNEQNKLQVPVFLLFHDFSLVRFDTLTISRAPPRLVKIWGWFLGPSYTFSDGPMDVEHWGII